MTGWQTWCSCCGVEWVSPEDPGHYCAICPACLVRFHAAMRAGRRVRRKREREASDE